MWEGTTDVVKPAQFVLTETGKLPFTQLTAEQKELQIYMNNNPNSLENPAGRRNL